MLLPGRDRDARCRPKIYMRRAGGGGECNAGASERDGGLVVWKGHALLPGRDRDTRFGPTIAIRQAGGVIRTQMRGNVQTSTTLRIYLQG